MPLSLNEYRTKLIDKILHASSPEAVKRFVNAAMKAFEQNNVNGYIVARFVDKMVSELDQSDLIVKDQQQWNNIVVAKVYFDLIKHKLRAIAD